MVLFGPTFQPQFVDADNDSAIVQFAVRAFRGQ
jgi:hypothetical protein